MVIRNTHIVPLKVFETNRSVLVKSFHHVHTYCAMLSSAYGIRIGVLLLSFSANRTTTLFCVLFNKHCKKMYFHLRINMLNSNIKSQNQETRQSF